MLGAAFTVGAVVRLSLDARRDELDIMQLVGAPFAFIRGPFVVEGLLLGGMGAARGARGGVGSCIPASRGWMLGSTSPVLAEATAALPRLGEIARWAADWRRGGARARWPPRGAPLTPLTLRQPFTLLLIRICRRARTRIPGFLLDRHTPPRPFALIEFYREEFIKHHQCLQAQREYFSAQAIRTVETALLKIIADLERLSAEANAEQKWWPGCCASSTS